jgi:hypothetical protein
MPSPRPSSGGWAAPARILDPFGPGIIFDVAQYDVGLYAIRCAP